METTKDRKRRRPFIVLDETGKQIGRGVCYDQGNVQVYMEVAKGAAWQMQLADVLLLKDVATFRLN
ncbi:MAG: hypothetical protein OXL96_13955 [Candidatus Poribacteria bacterium]|nr:hypothetical protein [Candidatus Poribacteria bacterium]